MSEKNKELVKKINDAFLTGEAEKVAGFLDENIKWNIVGMPPIQGKSEFIKTMEMMELESFPNMKIKNIIADGNFVVVEIETKSSSEVNLNLESHKPYTPSYCDIYYIKNEKIHELTTYMVDITFNNEL